MAGGYNRLFSSRQNLRLQQIVFRADMCSRRGGSGRIVVFLNECFEFFFQTNYGELEREVDSELFSLCTL